MYMVTTSLMKILNFFEIFEILKLGQNFEILNFKIFYFSFILEFSNFWNFFKFYEIL